ncbi:MAG: hypothetical protein JXB39_02580 [Deltaproteobacteria bacterium]|nr:hypothetical protein [Deltaproteobacteria bacterium]
MPAARTAASGGLLATILATGVSVRHAVSRALATANLSPGEATWQVLTARAQVDGSGRVVRADVTLRIRRPEVLEHLPLAERVGWVNPDGQHPLMALVPVPDPAGLRFVLLDVLPVTWDGWMACRQDAALPDDADPFCPFLEASWDEARAFARQREARLPSVDELRAAWGPAAYPWGARPDTHLGLEGRPRFDVCPAVGLHPPGSFGHFDLGAWLWHLTDSGRLFGGAAGQEGPPEAVAPEPGLWPVGFRCAVDVP